MNSPHTTVQWPPNTVHVNWKPISHPLDQSQESTQSRIEGTYYSINCMHLSQVLMAKAIAAVGRIKTPRYIRSNITLCQIQSNLGQIQWYFVEIQKNLGQTAWNMGQIPWYLEQIPWYLNQYSGIWDKYCDTWYKYHGNWEKYCGIWNKYIGTLDKYMLYY